MYVYLVPNFEESYTWNWENKPLGIPIDLVGVYIDTN